ncbi:MAG TPA: hypothetical protein VEK39_03965 [Solirubrobacterales bacterium]|nr:hypothetical protein [Solirubrobacterales bacterium]
MNTLKDRLRLPSPAIIVAVIALVAAMGGAAYAVKKIGPEGLKKNAVKTKKIVDKAVTTSKLADEAVTTVKLDTPERSEAFFTNQADATPVSTTAPPFTDADRVASLTLATGGHYVVTSSVDLASGGGGAIIQCALRDDGTVISRGSANTAGTEFSQTIALTGVVDGGSIDLVCLSSAAAQARSRVIVANRVASATTP